MKLKECLESLNQLVKDNPEALEYQVITSGDDEGNNYNKVHFLPSIGYYDGDDFVSSEDAESPNNSVCLN